MTKSKMLLSFLRNNKGSIAAGFFFLACFIFVFFFPPQLKDKDKIVSLEGEIVYVFPPHKSYQSYQWVEYYVEGENGEKIPIYGRSSYQVIHWNFDFVVTQDNKSTEFRCRFVQEAEKDYNNGKIADLVTDPEVKAGWARITIEYPEMGNLQFIEVLKLEQDDK